MEKAFSDFNLILLKGRNNSKISLKTEHLLMEKPFRQLKLFEYKNVYNKKYTNNICNVEQFYIATISRSEH